MGWNTDDDFNSVIDTLEPIILRRQGRPDDADTLQGWRFREVVALSESRPHCARRVDTTWQLPIGDLLDSPQTGDVIVDGSGAASTVIDVEQLRGASRYACNARRTELHKGKAERFDVDRPVYVATSEGTVVDRWERFRFAVKGCFGQVTESATERYEISTVCPVSFRNGDRIHRHRGGTYRVESVESTTAEIDLVVLSVVEESAYQAAVA